MVKSHAGILVPGSKESIWASARNSVSCTRSSARSILPHSEMANARRLGTVASTWSRIAGSSFICVQCLYFSILVVETGEQLVDVIRHTLADDVVVHGSQLLPDPGLDLSAKTRFGFM